MSADDQRTDTAALRELLAKATPGPWEATKRGIEGNTYDDVIAPGPVECMSHCYGGSSTVEGDRYDTDRALIVAAVNALPTLLDELDTARATLRRVEALADEYDAELWKQGLLEDGVESLEMSRFRAALAPATDITEAS